MNSVLQCLSNIQRFTSSVGDPPVGDRVSMDTTNNGPGSHKRKALLLPNKTEEAKSEL